jgi:protein-S-isoprenylcysteine O-methyltransferase Ste14
MTLPIIECSSILSLAWRTPETARLRDILYIPNDMSISMLQPSPLWTLGLTITLCGGLLRIRAIKDLGRFFTMEPDIAGDHNLITTGSFSIVRQPGYAGLILAMIGMDLIFISPGTWTRNILWTELCASSSWSPYIRALFLMNIAGQTLTTSAIIWSTLDEERVLQAKFGNEFKRFVVQTPWRLLPGVF